MNPADQGELLSTRFAGLRVAMGKVDLMGESTPESSITLEVTDERRGEHPWALSDVRKCRLKIKHNLSKRKKHSSILKTGYQKLIRGLRVTHWSDWRKTR